MMSAMAMGQETGFAAARHAMVASQLRTNAVNDARVVEAMSAVERERFVPDAVADLAYVDTPLPLGGGRYQNTPLATGRLLTAAELTADDRVLLIGAAGGYTAAVLARLVHSVVAVESDPALVAHARAALADAGRVEVIEAALPAGHPDRAPYDVLVVDGAVEVLPDALAAQVVEGGRIVSGRIDSGVARLAAGVRTAGGHGLIDFADIDCVVLPGFERPRAFQF